MKKRSKTESVKWAIKSAMARQEIETQEELAAMICMTPMALSRRMTGGSKWKIDDFRLLDKVLKFTDEELSVILRC